MFEATVAMAMLLREFNFRFAGQPEDTGMATGATIHTANGLNMSVTRRVASGGVGFTTLHALVR